MLLKIVLLHESDFATPKEFLKLYMSFYSPSFKSIIAAQYVLKLHDSKL